MSHQARWLDQAEAWQERTRWIEDRLSDALHERLVQRFVERSARRAGRPAGVRASGATRVGAAPVGTSAADRAPPPSHPFARLATLRAALPAEPSGPRGGGQERWVEEVIAAPHARFSVDARGRLSIDDRPLGQLTRGAGLLLPDVRLVGHEELSAGARSRILRRLVACARDLVEELLAPLRAPEARGLGAAGRGLVYQLEQGLGTVLAFEAEAQLAELGAGDRDLLAALGVEVGGRVIYLPALLRPQAVERRAALCWAWFEGRGRPVCPRAGAVSLRVPVGADARAYAAIGYPLFGPRALRADVAERVHQVLSAGGEGVDARLLASWMGCPGREVARVVEALEGG